MAYENIESSDNNGSRGAEHERLEHSEFERRGKPSLQACRPGKPSLRRGERSTSSMGARPEEAIYA